MVRMGSIVLVFVVTVGYGPMLPSNVLHHHQLQRQQLLPQQRPGMDTRFSGSTGTRQPGLTGLTSGNRSDIFHLNREKPELFNQNRPENFRLNRKTGCPFRTTTTTTTPEPNIFYICENSDLGCPRTKN